MMLFRFAAMAALLLPALYAWHDPVHAAITRAAVRALPAEMQARWEPRLQDLAERYSLYPDRFAGAKDAGRDRLAPFCTRPDGGVIHNVTWAAMDDINSLEHSFTGIIAGLRERDMDKALQHAGVLAHFVEDSTCPAHALIPKDVQFQSLRELIPPPPGMESISLHSVIERSSPPFNLDGRAPQSLGDGVPTAITLLLDRIYARVKENRAQTIDLIRAVYANDSAKVDAERLRCARNGAELLSDAFYTVFLLAGRGL
jgi:hypothetical protein